MFKNERKQYDIELETDMVYYTTRLQKKNIKPKLETPLFDLNQNVSDVKINILSVQTKNKGAIK
jgi:hypothetical protein